MGFRHPGAMHCWNVLAHVGFVRMVAGEIKNCRSIDFPTSDRVIKPRGRCLAWSPTNCSGRTADGQLPRSATLAASPA